MFENEINDLEFYLGNEDLDIKVTLAVIAKLREVNEMAKSSELSTEEISDLMHSDNSPLELSRLKDLPESMQAEVLEIQRGIIRFYAWDADIYYGKELEEI